VSTTEFWWAPFAVRIRRCSRAWTLLLAATWVLLAAPAIAALQDEIQVYTDDINKPREAGLELHVNATPSGRTTPDYPGEVPPARGVRFTPEFSYGLSNDWEAGLYVPALRTPDGNYDVAGAKLRLKWLPVRGDEAQGGWFAGANVELSRLAKKYSESRWTTELRIMLGYRDADWLVGLNPVFGWDLSDGLADGKPDVALGLKVARTVWEGIALGGEYYAEVGKLGDHLPANQQDHRLFVAVDVDRKPWVFNFGVGRGLTAAADRWTVKLIAELPF
jgi:hypothetical protein